MKSLTLGLIFFTIAALSSCGDDQIDLPSENLSGTVNGDTWNFKFGNAYVQGGTFDYTLRFLSDEEVGTDPCPFVSSTNPHLQVIMPLQIGNSVLPFTDFNKTLKFILGNGTQVSATSGFIEIVSIGNGRLIGYLQANFDDDNDVEGTFDIQLCN